MTPIAEFVALAMLSWSSLTSVPVHEAPVGMSLTEGEVWSAAYAASGSVRWADRATDVAWCESTWRTNAVGRAGEWGILQVHPVHGLPRVRGVEAQMEQAYEVWEQSGWGAWSCA